jgi:hypothetical protein
MGFFRSLFDTAEPYVIPPVMSVRVDDLPLRSATEGYHFLFSCTVRYQQVRPGEPHSAPHDVARYAVARQAVQLAASTDLLSHSGLESMIASYVGSARYELNGQLRVWATNVVVRVADADVQAMHKQHELRREMELWRHQKEMECHERDHVARMLVDPRQTVAWWVSRNPQHIGQAMGMVEPLTQLSAAIHGSPPAASAEPPEPRDQLLDAMAELFAPMDEWNRALLGDQIAKTLDTFGQGELSARIRDLLGAPTLVD